MGFKGMQRGSTPAPATAGRDAAQRGHTSGERGNNGCLHACGPLRTIASLRVHALACARSCACICIGAC
eukprot:7715409-Lingulodinium_polyedra.AAC.1